MSHDRVLCVVKHIERYISKDRVSRRIIGERWSAGRGGMSVSVNGYGRVRQNAGAHSGNIARFSADVVSLKLFRITEFEPCVAGSFLRHRALRSRATCAVQTCVLACRMRFRPAARTAKRGDSSRRPVAHDFRPRWLRRSCGYLHRRAARGSLLRAMRAARATSRSQSVR